MDGRPLGNSRCCWHGLGYWCCLGGSGFCQFRPPAINCKALMFVSERLQRVTPNEHRWETKNRGKRSNRRDWSNSQRRRRKKLQKVLEEVEPNKLKSPTNWLIFAPLVLLQRTRFFVSWPLLVHVYIRPLKERKEAVERETKWRTKPTLTRF